jgi:murein DD-endopeptidase MepM/ murein hydrolase activator NlpD
MNLCFLFLITLSLSDSACAAPPRTASPQKPKGVTHVVQQGQTLFRISQAYDVTVALLIEANRLKPSAPLKVGQRLFIPGAAAVKKVEAYRQLTTEERAALERSLREDLTLPPSPTTAPPAPPQPRVKTDAQFAWPIHGPINSPFGPRNGRLHAGIDIGSPSYQEVVAAADAEVIYANDTKGPLGKAVVLQHGRGMRTVYAHLSIIIARERDTIRQGQAIGGVGETGRATGPHLHFEIRQNGVPRNPQEYLPATIDELMRDLSNSK